MLAEIDINESFIQKKAEQRLKRRLSSEEMEDVIEELTQIAENEANSTDSIVDTFESLELGN